MPKLSKANKVKIKGQDIPELKGATGDILLIGNDSEGYKFYLLALDEPKPELVSVYTNFLPNNEEGLDEYQKDAENAPGKYVSIYSYDLRNK